MTSCRDNKQKLDDMLEKLKREHKDLSYGVDKFTMEISNLSDQEKSLQKQIKVR